MCRFFKFSIYVHKSSEKLEKSEKKRHFGQERHIVKGCQNGMPPFPYLRPNTVCSHYSKLALSGISNQLKNLKQKNFLDICSN